MHELSIALSVIEMAAVESRKQGGTVCAVHLRVGPLSGVVTEALTGAFELAREGTPLEAAELVIEDAPLVAYCHGCQREVAPPSVQELCCPDCGTPTPEIRRGRELDLVALEIVP